MFTQPLPTSGEAPSSDELIALAKLEATANAIRLRIAGFAPDQLYRGTTDQLSVAEAVSLMVARERAYLAAFQAAQSGSVPTLTEPDASPLFLDTDFADDLAAFFNLRRNTLDLLRMFGAAWDNEVVLPGGSRSSIRKLAIRLAGQDARMLQTITEQRRVFLRASGVDELRDSGVAGKLGLNIAQ